MENDPLKRKPVFGDIEQIEALRAIRVQEDEREGQTNYRINIEFSMSETFDIWADSEEDARDEAREWLDIDLADVDITVKEIST